MKKTQKNLYLLYMLFGVALVTANAIATKVFDMGFTVFGNEVTLTVGVICYPVTFLVTDIIGEIWGKKESSIAVKFGFILNGVVEIQFFEDHPISSIWENNTLPLPFLYNELY